MAFDTADQLKADTLQLAGEAASGSDFAGRVFDYLNEIQRALIAGRRLTAEVNLLPFDWWWARKYPRGELLLRSATNTDNSTQITLTQGSAAATLNASISTAMTNWRLHVVGKAQRPRISTNSGTSITLSQNWVEASTTTGDWNAYQADYALAADFVRFASPLLLSTRPYVAHVIDPGLLEDTYPFATIAQDTPAAAALVKEQMIRLSHYPDTDMVAEYEYLFLPTDLVAGSGEPTIPKQHRRILSLGAAYLITVDSSRTKQTDLLRWFVSAWSGMAQEQRRQLTTGNWRYGVVIPRPVRRPALLETESGIVLGYGGGYGAPYGV